MGEVIRLRPQPKKLCGDCMNAALSVYGVYCMVYKQAIHNEREAEECEEFESQYQHTAHPSKAHGDRQ